jgi:regulator of cell morphogenesis and NO signaling
MDGTRRVHGGEMNGMNTTLAELAVKHPVASRVFHRYGLDFCCGGNRPLETACADRGLVADAILAEIADEELSAGELPRWESRPIAELVGHIVTYYHRRLREELPMLVEMAVKVEAAHYDKPSRPRGLHELLENVHAAVLEHLAKEESILFPIILAGRGAMASRPIHVLEIEHEDHAENLKLIRSITADFTAPPEACTTWRALYRRLAAFEAELMDHIHLENNVLFRRALCE